MANDNEKVLQIRETLDKLYALIQESNQDNENQTKQSNTQSDANLKQVKQAFDNIGSENLETSVETEASEGFVEGLGEEASMVSTEVAADVGLDVAEDVGLGVATGGVGEVLAPVLNVATAIGVHELLNAPQDSENKEGLSSKDKNLLDSILKTVTDSGLEDQLQNGVMRNSMK